LRQLLRLYKVGKYSKSERKDMFLRPVINEKFILNKEKTKNLSEKIRRI